LGAPARVRRGYRRKDRRPGRRHLPGVEMTIATVTRAATETNLWTVQTLRNDDCLAELRDEWNDLFRRCATATPFQSYAWLESWWRTYGVPGRLRVALVRRDGRLVAAAALIRNRRWGCPVLTPVGSALPEFCDVLVDDGAPGGGPLLVDALLDERDWRLVDFAETRPGAAAGRALLATWPGRQVEVPASLCLELPARPIEDLVRDLPSHTK